MADAPLRIEPTCRSPRSGPRCIERDDASPRVSEASESAVNSVRRARGSWRRLPPVRWRWRTGRSSVTRRSLGRWPTTWRPPRWPPVRRTLPRAGPPPPIRRRRRRRLKRIRQPTHPPQPLPLPLIQQRRQRHLQRVQPPLERPPRRLHHRLIPSGDRRKQRPHGIPLRIGRINHPLHVLHKPRRPPQLAHLLRALARQHPLADHTEHDADGERGNEDGGGLHVGFH